MKYYLDTEFHEYKKTSFISKDVNTIELISIGIVAEDGREYYAISDEFDLKAAWNSYDEKIAEYNKLIYEDGSVLCYVHRNNDVSEELRYKKKESGNYKQVWTKGKPYKEYWLRDNVLKPVYEELLQRVPSDFRRMFKFTIRDLERLLNWYGKSNSEIAEEIVKFTGKTPVEKWEYSIHNNFHRFCLGTDEIVQINRDLTPSKSEAIIEAQNFIDKGDERIGDKTEFYAFYADYDWVVFCWLFGRMVDLPKGFPMYCTDLKQILDEKQKVRNKLKSIIDNSEGVLKKHEENRLVFPLNIKEHENYPKQENEHNALDDAKWNKKLHEFLNTL